MAVFANTSITIKVLEPRSGEKPQEGGDYYWGMVDKAAPKEKGYAAESQRLMYFGGELEDSRTLESAGMCNTDDPLLHLIPKA